MFQVGDQVYQLAATKTVRKGDIGVIVSRHNFIRAKTRIYYEVEFQGVGGPFFRLRYETEIAAVTPAMVAVAMGGPLPVGAGNNVGTPKFKVGDQVAIINKASSYWSQTGEVIKVNTTVKPWEFTVEFPMPLSQKVFWENHLIASTAPTKTLKNPFGHIYGKHLDLNSPAKAAPTSSSKQCTCPMQGPHGLIAVGCKCGAVKPYNSSNP
jgi:hypothetical protein